MIAPINATLATIMAQLSCGVKAVQYTPSIPVTTPFAYGLSTVPYGAYGGGVPCPPCGDSRLAY